jgi:hypothetical protein|tara:strand:+ start:829 stop:999 length:171 start_codon:yes stop_codon:yes gene_type:complete
MDNKNNINTEKNNSELKLDSASISKNSDTGIYLRDDHCDWGSSGMNEFTNEFGGNG